MPLFPFIHKSGVQSDKAICFMYMKEKKDIVDKPNIVEDNITWEITQDVLTSLG